MLQIVIVTTYGTNLFGSIFERVDFMVCEDTGCCVILGVSRHNLNHCRSIWESQKVLIDKVTWLDCFGLWLKETCPFQEWDWLLGATMGGVQSGEEGRHGFHVLKVLSILLAIMTIRECELIIATIGLAGQREFPRLPCWNWAVLRLYNQYKRPRTCTCSVCW
jgi:hypothetical protein